MRHAQHVGSCSKRIVAASISRYANTLQPNFGRMPPPRPAWHVSSPRRTLHLSSTAPIQFSSDNKTIIFRLRDGKTISQKFSPSPIANLSRLRERLIKLLQSPDKPPVTDLRCDENEQDMSDISFGTTEWFLDPEGDSIHRHTAHTQAGEVPIIEELIQRRAEETHHHPHITRGDFGDGEDKLMTITCTTHNPRGLSLRDLNLALKINEILAQFNTVAPFDPGTSPDLDRQRIAAKCEWMVARNREKINEALGRCGCAPGKLSTSSPDKPAKPVIADQAYTV